MSDAALLAPPDTPERRVFVNASLRLDSIQAIGFDMDYTLAAYDERYLERVAFDLAAPHLEDIGYPPIVRSLQYRPVRGIRGLTVDLELGNVPSPGTGSPSSTRRRGGRRTPTGGSTWTARGTRASTRSTRSPTWTSSSSWWP
jgi:hypothetical protein